MLLQTIRVQQAKVVMSAITSDSHKKGKRSAARTFFAGNVVAISTTSAFRYQIKPRENKLYVFKKTFSIGSVSSFSGEKTIPLCRKA